MNDLPVVLCAEVEVGKSSNIFAEPLEPLQVFKAAMRDDINEWSLNNFGYSPVAVLHGIAGVLSTGPAQYMLRFYFKTEEDATLFKLFWL